MQLKLGMDEVENVGGAASFCWFGVAKPASAFSGGLVFEAFVVMATVFLTMERGR
jgi:hypothetical protein